MNRKRAAAVVVLAAWAWMILTYTRPWPSPDTVVGALAVIIVGLTLYAAVVAPVIYFIGVPLYRRGRPNA